MCIRDSVSTASSSRGNSTHRLPRGSVRETMAGKPTPLGPKALDTALNALLAEYPTAFVAAINADGVFVPMPASVPLRGQQVLQARSVLDLVVSEDRQSVISTWSARVKRALPARR